MIANDFRARRSVVEVSKWVFALATALATALVVMSIFLAYWWVLIITIEAVGGTGLSSDLPTLPEMLIGVGLIVLAFMAGRGLPTTEEINNGIGWHSARLAFGFPAILGAVFGGIIQFGALSPLALVGVLTVFCLIYAPEVDERAVDEAGAVR